MASPYRRSMMGVQPSSELRTAPSYGFGTAERPYLGEKFGGGPGPVYYPKAVNSHLSDSPSPSFGTSHRGLASGKSSIADAPVPGPGQYSSPGSISRQSDSQKISCSSWKFGTSTRRDMAKVFISSDHAKSQVAFIDSPGPVAYNHPGAMAAQSDSRKNTSASYGVGTAGRFFTASASSTPGPGSYQLTPFGRQVTSNKSSMPVITFPRADRNQSAQNVYLGRKQAQVFLGRNSPGPASYSPTESVGNQVSSKKRTGPKFGFGTADRFGYMEIAKRATQTPGPGSYST